MRDDELFQEEMEFLGGQKAHLPFAEVAQNIKPVLQHKQTTLHVLLS